MKTPNIQKKMELIAMVALESARKLSLEGKGLSYEALTAALKNSEELVEALNSPASGKSQKEEMLRLKKEVEKLTLKNKKITAHRRELTVQLDAAENQGVQGKAFIQRAIPALIQLARTGDNSQVHKNLNQIKSLVKKAAPLDQLENAFQQLKENTYRTELEKSPVKPASGKASSLFNLFRRQAPDGDSNALVHFKETYLTIVQELRLNLDQTALDELTRIERRLRGELQFNDFFEIRDDVLVLLKNYISRISTERKQAAAFILEIGKHLAEVEHHLLQSLVVAQKNRDAHVQFTDTMEKEMSVFQEAVDFSQSLEELKSKVVASIAAIKKAVENSRQDVSSRNEQSDQQVVVLKKHLDRLKGEIKSARLRSETLEHELLSDPLTRAYNRRAYDQRIDNELKRYHRYKNIFSMLLLDVDHFKQINDQYGHSVGDLCLKEIINRIKPLLRETDFLARYGGEEFVIILPETTISGAAEVAEKIRAHIEKTDFLHKGERVNITISLGGTEADVSDKNGDEIFERADKAMYQAKQSGRNRVVIFSESEES